MENTYILHFTISSVQDFIAQARKTNDLFTGSEILSHLSATAKMALLQSGGEWEIVLPAPNASGSSLNAFVAVSHAPLKREELVRIGKRIEASAKSELKKMFMDVLDRFGLYYPYEDWFHMAEIQIEELLEIYWVFVPYTEATYAEDYRKSLTAIQSVKAGREFNQIGEVGRKCILDGTHNALFYRATDREQQQQPATFLERKFFNNPVKVVNDKLPLSLLQAGEGVSAIGLLKRGFLHEKKAFESTTEIALKAAITQLNKEKSAHTLLGKFLRSAKGEAQLLYAENLRKEYLRKKGLSQLARPEMLKTLREHRDQVEKAAEDLGSKFTDYYALLMLDGDGMGEWFSGFSLEGTREIWFIDKHKLKEFQIFLSRCLADFSESITPFINQGKGRVVFDGGDDFMTFITLPRLFKVLIEVQRVLDEKVNVPLFAAAERFGLDREKRITLSGGLSIAHYKYPLSEVLGHAESLLKISKSQVGKGSLSIGALRHGGNYDLVNYPWKVKEHSFIHLLQQITKSFQSDFSDNFFRTLLQTFRFSTLEWETSVKGGADPISEPLLKRELRRLLRRSNKITAEPGEALVAFEQRKEIANQDLEEAMLSLLAMRQDLAINFLGTLAITEFIHRNLHSNDI